MSVHIFTRGRLRVVAGWDRPLQHHHLTVTCGDNVLYSNINDAALDGGGMTAVQVLAKLAFLGIRPPERLFEQLQRDERDDVGNDVTNYAGEVP